MSQKGVHEKRPFELIEEAVSLVRHAGPTPFVAYYLGSVPFILALLYFWADMGKSAAAYRYLPVGSLGLALLFIWMKAWQTVYSRVLFSRVTGRANEGWSLKSFFRMTARQAFIHPWGLILLPVSLVAVIPFGQVYAFFQNTTVLDNGGPENIRSLSGRSSEQAKLFGRQNMIIIWALSPFLVLAAAVLFLVIMPVMEAISPDWTEVIILIYSVIFVITLMPLSPFGVTVAANISIAILILPGLAKTFLGIESVYAASPGAMVNGTFFAVVCGLTYLLLDPVIKAAYVLRCFYGESLGSGEDLMVRLRDVRASRAAAGLALVIAFITCLSFPTASKGQEAKENSAQETSIESSVSPEELDSALRSELSSRRYSWRAPRAPREPGEGGFINTMMESISDQFKEWGRWVVAKIKKFLEWLDDLMPEWQPQEEERESRLSDWLQLILYILLAVLLSVAGVFLYRLWKSRHALTGEAEAEAVETTVPDLEDEDTTADELPEHGWLEMARQMASKGDMRLALRAVFLATLASLSRFEMVRIARFKSNRDYELELARHAHEWPEAPPLFADSVKKFEAVWYGTHQADTDMFRSMIENHRRLGHEG